jgi:hypothetical protein
MEKLDINTLILFGIAVANAWTAYLALRTRGDMRDTRIDMHTLEQNTNSIKDALVARTAEASEAKGRDSERLRGEQTAANLAKGNLEQDRRKD